MSIQRSFILVGAGRAGSSVASALHGSSARLSAVASRTREHALHLANQFAIPFACGSVEELPKDFSHCIIAVRDTAIGEVASQFASAAVSLEGKTFLHLSGAETIAPLGVLAEKGARTASFHIMQSFPGDEIVSVGGCAAAIETGDDQTYADLHALALQLHLKPFRLRTEQKALYHCIGVYVSNFLTGNLYAAQKLYNALQITGVSFFDIIAPIAAQTLDNAESFGVVHSLSGPAERGAGNILERHMRAIEENPALGKEILDDYLHRTLQILKVAGEKNPGEDARYRELAEKLSSLR